MPKSTALRSATGRVSKNAMFSRSAAISGSRGARLIALRSGLPGALTGQACTHSSHPVQSSRYTCSVNAVSGRPRASSGAERNASGADSSSASS